MPGPTVTVSAYKRTFVLGRDDKEKAHLQKGGGEKIPPAFASKGGEGTKHSFLTFTGFSAV
jgi:hypothetical protein